MEETCYELWACSKVLADTVTRLASPERGDAGNSAPRSSFFPYPSVSLVGASDPQRKPIRLRVARLFTPFSIRIGENTPARDRATTVKLVTLGATNKKSGAPTLFRAVSCLKRHLVLKRSVSYNRYSAGLAHLDHLTLSALPLSVIIFIDTLLRIW